MGEDHDRSIGAVSLEVPHREVGSVRGPDDPMVGSGHDVTPAEQAWRPSSPEEPVSGAGVGQPPVGHPGRSTGGHGRPE